MSLSFRMALTYGALACLATFPSSVKAQVGGYHVPGINEIRQKGRDLDRYRLDAMSQTPRAGVDYTRFHVTNDFSEPIWVSLVGIPYYPPVNGSTSNLSSTGGNSGSQWEHKGWYKIQPGQRAYLFDTPNGRVYYHAKTRSGKQWAGKTFTRVGQKGVGYYDVQFLRAEQFTLSIR